MLYLTKGIVHNMLFIPSSTWVKDFDDCLLNRGNNLMLFMRTGFSCLSSQFVAQHFTKLSSSANTLTTFQEVSRIVGHLHCINLGD